MTATLGLADEVIAGLSPAVLVDDFDERAVTDTLLDRIDLAAELGRLVDGWSSCWRTRARRAPSELRIRLRARQQLRSVERRWQHLTAKITELDTAIAAITTEVALILLAQFGVPTSRPCYSFTAGRNKDRMHRESSFAALCWVGPLPASSGKTNRHRLNRGGDRQANAAPHNGALTRMRSDPRTREYVAERTAQGRGKREIMRCLKRYIARDLYPLSLLSQTG